MKNYARFREFLARFSTLLDAGADEATIFRDGSPLLAHLVRHDDWLPDECARPLEGTYRQYLLYCDARERFSVASFVWAPGVKTPLHDHTVWGMVAVMRGAELCHEYEGNDPSRRRGMHRVEPGDVDLVSPTVGDLHVVENALTDRVSVSIHVYGANIGAVRRRVFAEDGTPKEFVSGYHNAELPNFWDRSRER